MIVVKIILGVLLMVCSIIEYLHEEKSKYSFLGWFVASGLMLEMALNC